MNAVTTVILCFSMMNCYLFPSLNAIYNCKQLVDSEILPSKTIIAV